MNYQLHPAELKNEKQRKLSRQDMKVARNKTIKKKREEKTYTMDNIVKGMTEGESDDELATFNPPPQAILQSQKDSEARESMEAKTKDAQKESFSSSDRGVTPEEFRSIDPAYSPQNYTSYVPYYTQSSNTQQLDGPKDTLLEKLNYMIHLLEEQKEEKTGHVAEELILYSFLGVFVIFVVDSFARVGKYVR